METYGAWMDCAISSMEISSARMDRRVSSMKNPAALVFDSVAFAIGWHMGLEYLVVSQLQEVP